MQRYFGFMPNDFINGCGVCVSLWTAGCPHKCPGCHNAHMWDYNAGYIVPDNLIDRLKKAITANGIQRDFSVLGGEPFAPENKDFVLNVVREIKQSFPDINIIIWTGYTIDQLKEKDVEYLRQICQVTDFIIDGPYIQEQRDVSLRLRGSRNQHIEHCKEIELE